MTANCLTLMCNLVSQGQVFLKVTFSISGGKHADFKINVHFLTFQRWRNTMECQPVTWLWIYVWPCKSRSQVTFPESSFLGAIMLIPQWIFNFWNSNGQGIQCNDYVTFMCDFVHIWWWSLLCNVSMAHKVTLGSNVVIHYRTLKMLEITKKSKTSINILYIIQCFYHKYAIKTGRSTMFGFRDRKGHF